MAQEAPDTTDDVVRPERGAILDEVLTEVLGYVQYEKQDLVRRMRKRLERAVRARKVNIRESALLIRRKVESIIAPAARK